MSSSKKKEVEKNKDVQPSATLILLRQSQQGIETVLLKRHKAMSFGSAWVFPGGKIDPQDYQTISTSLKSEEKEISAAVHAAVRETQEEASVDIDPKSLVLMSCWTTPLWNDRPRFRTWFFVAEIGEQEIIVDGSEMLDHRWINVKEIAETENVKSLGILPPTYNTLLDINRYQTVEKVMSGLKEKPLQIYNPRLVPTDYGFVSLYQGDAGYETEDLSAIGDRHRLINTKDGYYLEKNIDW